MGVLSDWRERRRKAKEELRKLAEELDNASYKKAKKAFIKGYTEERAKVAEELGKQRARKILGEGKQKSLWAQFRDGLINWGKNPPSAAELLGYDELNPEQKKKKRE